MNRIEEYTDSKIQAGILALHSAAQAGETAWEMRKWFPPKGPGKPVVYEGKEYTNWSDFCSGALGRTKPRINDLIYLHQNLELATKMGCFDPNRTPRTAGYGVTITAKALRWAIKLNRKDVSMADYLATKDAKAKESDALLNTTRMVIKAGKDTSAGTGAGTGTGSGGSHKHIATYEELKAENKSLRAQVAQLEARVRQLEGAGGL